jgi:hypothetical protein
MDDVVENPLPEFEDTYQRFIEAGGFKLPALAEDWERDARKDQTPTPSRRCPHGLTFLTCSECYFQKGLYGK